MTESFDLGSLIDEFRDEARDQVDRLDAALLRLDREGELDDDTRRALLRTLHTLKGNAGMLGLSAIRDFVHVSENVLKAAPSAWAPPTVERLFDGATALRAAIEAAGQPEQEEAFRELTVARHRLDELDAEPEAGPVPTASPDAAVSGGGGAGDRLRVPFHKLDALLNQVGELVGETDALAVAVGGAKGPRPIREQVETLRRQVDGLRESVMGLRLVPLGRVLNRFHGLVRRLAREQGKEAHLVLEGEATEVDKSTGDALAEPLLHLIRNAVDHGIRPPGEREAEGKPRYGTIRIQAEQEGDRVRIVVEDDGRGLDRAAIRARGVEAGLVAPDAPLEDREVVELIFRPGFSTRTDVSTVSGRGVGLDVVRRSIRDLRGALRVEAGTNGGTRFVIRLPLTVAIVPSLVVEVAGEVLAVPTSAVARTVRLDRLERVGRTEVVRADDDLVAVADPARLFGWPAASPGGFAVVVRHADRSAAVRVDRLVDQRDLMVKALPSYTGRRPGLSGASVLPGGRVILVLDPAEVIELNDGGQGGDA